MRNCANEHDRGPEQTKQLFEACAADQILPGLGPVIFVAALGLPAQSDAHPGCRCSAGLIQTILSSLPPTPNARASAMLFCPSQAEGHEVLSPPRHCRQLQPVARPRRRTNRQGQTIQALYRLEAFFSTLTSNERKRNSDQDQRMNGRSCGWRIRASRQRVFQPARFLRFFRLVVGLA